MIFSLVVVCCVFILAFYLVSSLIWTLFFNFVFLICVFTFSIFFIIVRRVLRCRSIFSLFVFSRIFLVFFWVNVRILSCTFSFEVNVFIVVRVLGLIFLFCFVVSFTVSSEVLVCVRNFSIVFNIRDFFDNFYVWTINRFELFYYFLMF